jgi:hypothetical protein
MPEKEENITSAENETFEAEVEQTSEEAPEGDLFAEKPEEEED